jgi:hypothetical protein
MEAMEAVEDFNIPSAERVALLERLQGAIGGAPPHFWAACQICDLKALETLIDVAHIEWVEEWLERQYRLDVKTTR